VKYEFSTLAFIVFSILVCSVLALSFWLGRKAKSAKGYYAAHGTIPWFINGVAFAGDYLSAASFLGICGLIAFYGYDGFLYSIGFLAGWVVALFVIAEPIKRLGKFTFADALDSQFNSRGIKLAAAISTLVVSLFYLIPQMVGAGTLIKPLLGLPIEAGVIGVGIIVILIVTTAGMVSTTWVQFIKGSMLVLFCGLITLLLFAKGFTPKAKDAFPRTLSNTEFAEQILPGGEILPASGPWEKQSFLRLKMKDGSTSTWLVKGQAAARPNFSWPSQFIECETTTTGGPEKLVNGLPQKVLANDLKPINYVERLPLEVKPGQPLGPLSYLSAFQHASIATIGKTTVKETLDGTPLETTIYYPVIRSGGEILTPGGHPTLFKGLQVPQNPTPAQITQQRKDQLNFISFMLALFCGTAALPHILIRYYTVKDQASARKSTVVGIAAIGLFYILTLYLGLGAMTTGPLDPTDSNMAAPLLAKAFGEFAFALISAIAFTTVLGTVSGLIIAASGAVAHDLLHNLFQMNLDDHAKVRAGKIASVSVGIVAIILGILFQKMNVSFLVGWAFNVAASANLPAITMLLFWKRTTRQGIAASIFVGLLSSLAWIFLSTDAFANLYGYSPAEAAAKSPVPFNQPALVTIPLAYLTLIVVSLATRKTERLPVPVAAAH
jgi:cation/acetate symporter